MIDFIKLKRECEEHEHRNEHIEITMEICHYLSIAILSLFVIEIIVKIYAFARNFWNFHQNKMEYLDSIIVLVSLGIDLYFLRGEEAVIGHRTLLIISFRLWRFVRIINIKKYVILVHRLLAIIIQKTQYTQQIIDDDNNDRVKEKLDLIIKKFQEIDQTCEQEINKLNHELKVIAQVADQLQTIEF
ncbi:unnamed protein product [Didymodactylos carnosus]|nr:unnamed protein product [Didymodactylos carnosus]CAF4379331.1 unnamed protein product [Didymodactylos carnosus]